MYTIFRTVTLYDIKYAIQLFCTSQSISYNYFVQYKVFRTIILYSTKYYIQLFCTAQTITYNYFVQHKLLHTNTEQIHHVFHLITSYHIILHDVNITMLHNTYVHYDIIHTLQYTALPTYTIVYVCIHYIAYTIHSETYLSITKCLFFYFNQPPFNEGG